MRVSYEATATWCSLFDAMNTLSLDNALAISFWQVCTHARAIPEFAPGFVLLKRLDEGGDAIPFWPTPMQVARGRRGRGRGARGGRGHGGGRHLGHARGRGGLVIDGGHDGDATDDAHEALGGDEDLGALEAGLCGAEEISEDCDTLVESEDEVS